MKKSILPVLLILIYITAIPDLLCADVILLFNDVLLNGKITKIIIDEKNKIQTPRQVSIKTAEAELTIEGKNIIKYWLTSSPEDDLKIYKKLKRTISQKMKESIINRAIDTTLQKPEIIIQGNKEPVTNDETAPIIKKKIHRLHPITSGSIALLSVGGSVFLSGLAIFIYDVAGYFPVVDKYTQKVSTDNSNKQLYDSYTEVYNVNIALFSAGLSCALLGLTSLIISIPLLFKGIKAGKKKKITVNLTFDKYIGLALSMKL